MGKNGLNAHAAFGDTNRADGVPDCLVPDNGPVYLEGRLVLSLSFQGGPINVHTEEAGDLVERFRIWDDLEETWHADGLEVLRFEQADVVVRLGQNRARSIHMPALCPCPTSTRPGWPQIGNALCVGGASSVKLSHINFVNRDSAAFLLKS